MPNRIVCWFSCGATSAVATKLTLTKFNHSNIIIAYCDTGSEHPDNKRFIADCENWFNHKIIRLKSDKYADIWQVFDRTRYLVGVAGARCTTELKKLVRRKFEQLDDVQVWGFDNSERKRITRFKENNPEINISTPLIDNDLSKENCLAIIDRAGIEIPTMYKLGYNNNNCIGCVKGQQGYWNKIRKDFPDVFYKMAMTERILNVAINKYYDSEGNRNRIFLDELDPSAGKNVKEPRLECDLFCGAVAELLT